MEPLIQYGKLHIEHCEIQLFSKPQVNAGICYSRKDGAAGDCSGGAEANHCQNGGPGYQYMGLHWGHYKDDWSTYAADWQGHCQDLCCANDDCVGVTYGAEGPAQNTAQCWFFSSFPSYPDVCGRPAAGTAWDRGNHYSVVMKD